MVLYILNTVLLFCQTGGSIYGEQKGSCKGYGDKMEDAAPYPARCHSIAGGSNHCERQYFQESGNGPLRGIYAVGGEG